MSNIYEESDLETRKKKFDFSFLSFRVSCSGTCVLPVVGKTAPPGLQNYVAFGKVF